MGIKAEKIDAIGEAIQDKPYIGSELEFALADAKRSFEPVRSVSYGGSDLQPADALKKFLADEGEPELSGGIAREVGKFMVEINHEPALHPRSVAAKEKLTAIIAQRLFERLGRPAGQDLAMIYGAPWRPPKISERDVPDDAPAFQKTYYGFQIGQNGDGLSATGVHFNISTPWIKGSDDARSDKLIRTAGQYRLLAGAVASALTASSPLSYISTGHQDSENGYVSYLSRFNSARIGGFWAGRTIMDVSALYSGYEGFQETMRSFAENGILYSGRDLWLPVRPQPNAIKEERNFDKFCEDNCINLKSPEGFERASRVLLSLFKKENDPFSADNILRGRMEKWRQGMLDNLIKAPRHRAEIRTPEAPYSFDDQTSYEYMKAAYAFLELLFMYVSTEPDSVSNLTYSELQLNAAKHNETKLNRGDLASQIYYIPSMHSASGRDVLKKLLSEIDPLVKALGREADITIIREIAEGVKFAPAERIRREVSQKYSLALNRTYDDGHALPDTEYQKELLARNVNSMGKEVDQIEADSSSLPATDRVVVEKLIKLARSFK